jgi:hypothetical protein
MVDGYCHDCYVRGRHLPEDNEPWPETESPKKKQQPGPKPFSPTRRPSVWRRLSLPIIGRKWMLLLIILVASVWIFNDVFRLSIADRLLGESDTMNMIRGQNFLDAKSIDAAALPEKKSALDEYINSGASYRAEGELFYVYHWNDLTLKRFTTTVEMDYNADTEVFRFSVESEDWGYRDSEDEHLAPYYIPTGEYFIVSEGDVVWVLSETDGERNAVPQADAGKLYGLLMGLRMERMVETDFITGEIIADISYNTQIADGYYYFGHFPDEETGIDYSQYAIKAYGSKPVKYEYHENNQTTKTDMAFTMAYYYDGISEEAPSVKEYQP